MTEAELDKNPQVNIRPATAGDLPRITEILRATVQSPYGSGNVDENEVASELAKIQTTLSTSTRDGILVAQDQTDQTAGFAFYKDTPDSRITIFTGLDPALTSELYLLYLDPAKRGAGIGSQLLRAVEQQAKASDKTKVAIVSGPRYILIGTGRFYLKQGYSLAGTIQKYFEDKYWARVFQKELS